ncbi:MAG TPA: TPM domain-containing protein [Bryobacteraceae bacterium]|jgi:uncharacterized membrane protein|nr:TPM domain-containing protein [Bryobacteraceae bacterium]
MVAIDNARVVEAIRRAELRTSGEIRVAVSRPFWGSVRRAAEKAFVRLNMTATKDRNGVLIFVVPLRRRFVVLGDTGIHERVGQEFWEQVVRIVSEKFRQRDFTEGLVQGIAVIGEQLSTHFPYDPATDKNELPDDIDYEG